MVPITADESAKQDFSGSRKRPYNENSEEEPCVAEYAVERPHCRFMLAAQRLRCVLQELDTETRITLMNEIVRILSYRAMLAHTEPAQITKHPRLSE